MVFKFSVLDFNFMHENMLNRYLPVQISMKMARVIVCLVRAAN